MPHIKGRKYKRDVWFPIPPQILICALCPRKFKRTHSQHKYCGWCKRKAALQKMKEWHEKNTSPEKRRANYRRHYAKNAAKIIERTKAYTQTERGKEARRIADANQKIRNAKKVAARQIVRMALVGGILTKQPCERCGALKVEAHHEDYDKPLEVNWLCFDDHRRLHKERGDGPSSSVVRSKGGRFTEKEVASA